MPTPWIVHRLPKKRTNSLSFPNCPDRSWSPSSVLFNWGLEICSQGIEGSEDERPSTELKMDTHETRSPLPLALALRLHGTRKHNFAFTDQTYLLMQIK
jgi:hypothetical protein